MIKKIKMEGLMCSSCVDKIEKELKTISYIRNATFNFTNQVMLIEVTEEYDEQKAIDVIRKVVDSIETGVTTYLPHESYGKETKRFSYINHFTLGIVLFSIALLYEQILPSIVVITLYYSGYILTSKTILRKTWNGLKRGDYFNENTLMVIATIAAMILGEYLEAIMVVLFYSFGELLQHKAVKRSKNEIKGLIDLKVDYANVLFNDEILIKMPEEIVEGDILVVRNGEKIPVDGIVTSGSTQLNTSALTGESKLTFVESGDQILSGNLNVGGVIKIKATKRYEDSTVYKIIDLIENSTNTKANPETFITKFARIYTPTVTILALLMFLIPTIINPANINIYTYRAATFLVISCPCALVLSIPLSYFSGIGSAAQNGILLKGGNFLHMLTEIDTIGFDKTGTLTKGDFSVTRYTDIETLKLAASLDVNSTHPIAKSILEKYDGELLVFDDVEEIPGYGVSGYSHNDFVLVGNKRLLESRQIAVPPISNDGTSVFVAKNNTYLGHIILEDEVRESSMSAMELLQSHQLVMLTGDNDETASKIANQLGIKNYHSELLPKDKISHFNKLESVGLKMFIGDGVNDAPLIRNADIGVAIGSGSEIAIDVADIIIMDQDLTKVDKAFKIAKKTKRIVYQNIAITLSLKLLIVVLAGFGLSSMLAAIFADVGVSLIAVMNTLRIIYSKEFYKKKGESNLYRISDLFKTFSNITLLSILELLTRNSHTVDSLVLTLNQNETTIETSIQSLMDKNLVKEYRVDGTNYYKLSDKHVKKLVKLAKAHSHC